MVVGAGELGHHAREGALFPNRHTFQRFVNLFLQFVFRNRDKALCVEFQFLQAGLKAFLFRLVALEIGIGQIEQHTGNGDFLLLGEFFFHDDRFLLQRNDFF